MITPSKHLNLELSVLRISAYLLQRLRRYRVVSVSEATSFVETKLGPDAKVYLSASLNLLYLLGRIAYHSHNDSLEYIEE